MKRIILFFVTIASSAALFAQVEKPVDSKITGVTVFLNKAQVTREVKTRVEAGKSSLIVTGLTALMDIESIQASGKGSFIILGITHRQNYLNEFTEPKSLKQLKDSLTYYQKESALERSRIEILNKEEQMLISNQHIGGTNQNLTVAELKAMADFYRSRLGELVNTRMKHDENIRKMTVRIAKLQVQINEQNDIWSRNTGEIVVNVSAEAATSAELEINYVVNNAGWNPIYDLRAVNTKNPVQISYKANVFQQTGEEWKNVKLKLSTANPTQGGLKPELYAWYLDFYQPIPYGGAMEMKKAYRSAPAAKMAEEQADMAVAAAPAETVASFVNTIQTTLNTEFDITLPYTVASSAKPTVVDIRNYDMKAVYEYAVAPKLDNEAFLIAKGTGWEEFNLLPGEANIFFEGTFVGKTFVDPNNIKDTLAVSLGRDKRIVVKREKLKDVTSRKVIGGSQRESYTWEISVRNTRTEAIKINIEDQIPVSQNTQIEVTPVDLGGGKLDAATGKLTWTLNLQPNETKKVSFKFDIKYPKDKTINGL